VARDSITVKRLVHVLAILAQHGDAMNVNGENLNDDTSEPGTDTVVDVELERWEARRTETTVRYASRVTALLASRPDLRGISPLADSVEEATRWAV
jgi:hypothetical protein